VKDRLGFKTNRGLLQIYSLVAREGIGK